MHYNPYLQDLPISQAKKSLQLLQIFVVNKMHEVLLQLCSSRPLSQNKAVGVEMKLVKFLL